MATISLDANALALDAYVERNYEATITLGMKALVEAKIPVLGLAIIIAMKRLGRIREAEAMSTILLQTPLIGSPLFLAYMMILDGATDAQQVRNTPPSFFGLSAFTPDMECQLYFCAGAKHLTDRSLMDSVAALRKCLSVVDFTNASFFERKLALADLISAYGPLSQISERVKEIAQTAGRKLDAIRAYREETGFGLTEAKDVIEQFISKEELAKRVSTISLSERVKELALAPGRKLEAIRAFREETGMGLAEAKLAVESFVNRQNHTVNP